MTAVVDKPVRYWLRSVTLERFKAAFKPDPVELRDFNLLVGRNGSGKSTLLEALQWLDTTLRSDARAASDRYFGVRDLINLRCEAQWFRIGLSFGCGDDEAGRDADPICYQVKVHAEDDGTPTIQEESLWTGERKRREDYIKYDKPTQRRVRSVLSESTEIPFEQPDRLALSLGGTKLEVGLRAFWRDAVFLRLSPGRLAKGSPARRKSFDPLLDEEGQNLPALLFELTAEQRQDLIERVQRVLPGMRDVKLDTATGRDTIVNYSLLERMPYKGRTGRSNFPIPSWMLSEGTRRITALFALLVHDPPPSLLCIEEVENGLDPQTTLHVLNELRSAVSHGTQVLATTHSPWLLDHVELQDIIVARRESGNTVYERLADLQEIKAYAADIPPGTRYVNEVK